MATGACGINCDVCRLNLQGLCTSCGSGKSPEAGIKLAAQKRVLGDTCPILTCACMNQKAHCIRDCDQFPCDNFTLIPYPFSPAYLEMQKRRRQEWVPSIDPLGKPIQIPDKYWEEVEKKDVNLIKTVSLAQLDDRGRILFRFLDLDLRLDPMGKEIAQKNENNEFTPITIPLLTLTSLIYFKSVDRLFPMGKDLISTKDMAGQGKYFTGEHKLGKDNLLKRFADDAKGFDSAVQALGGKTIDIGDIGRVLYPFPRLAIYYVFWDLESEYDPRLSILFDRSIQNIFTPPMVWELVNLVNARLLSV